MGAGASTVKDPFPATEADALAAGYTAEQVGAAFDWTDEYGAYMTVSTTDVAQLMALGAADAQDQVLHEPRAPRFAIYGTPTASAAPDAPLATDRVFWIASFENREAYHVDHLNRETNQAFSKAFFPLMKGGPMAALAGSYRGALYHLEKPGAAHVSEGCHAVVCGASAKDAASAAELVALLKADARAQLAEEAGALRCTIVPPGAVGMVEGDMPPGHPSFADATTLVWARAWRTAADYAAHRASSRASAAAPAIAALVDEASRWTLEFGSPARKRQPSPWWCSGAIRCVIASTERGPFALDAAATFQTST